MAETAKKRPFLVSLLAILALLGALAAIWHMLQYLHILPIAIETVLGTVRFYGYDLGAAILWALLALIYLWTFRKLWAVDVRGWLFVTVFSSLNLMLSGLAVVGESTVGAMLPSLVINGLIFVYCLMPGTKEAFGVQTSGQPLV
jgi:hypothetical protein